MATKTIDNMDFYVDIKPYQTGDSDQTFSSLRVSAGYRKGRGFYAGYHPGWGDGAMWGCLFDFSSNPLTAGITVDVEPATKNSSKRIGQMLESLKAAKEGIRVFFEQREFDCLRVFLKSVAKDGYLPEYEKQVVDYVQRVKRGITEPTTETNNNNSNNQTSTTMEPKNNNQNESANVQAAAQVSNTEGTESVDVQELGVDDIKPRVTSPQPPKGGNSAAENTPSRGAGGLTMPLGSHGTLVIAGVGSPQPLKGGKDAAENTPSGCGECKDLKSDERIANANTHGGAIANHAERRVGSPQPLKGGKDAAENTPSRGQGGLSVPQVRLVVYTTKRGEQAPRIEGFGGDADPRWKRHYDEKQRLKKAAKEADKKNDRLKARMKGKTKEEKEKMMKQWVSVGSDPFNASIRVDYATGDKTYTMVMGAKYMDVAQQLVDAYNSGDAQAIALAEQAVMDVKNGIVAGLQAAREARKGASPTPNPAPKGDGAATGEKQYTLDEVAAMLGKLLPDGAASTEDIKKLMMAA